VKSRHLQRTYPGTLASWKADSAPVACVYLPFLLANKMWEDHPVFLGCSIQS
jgi:hypothetical protein